MKFHTWQAEWAFVAAALGIVLLVTHGGPIELLGSLAVLAGFAHAQVSDRLAEHARATDQVFSTSGTGTKHRAHCWRWSTRYFFVKEALWLGYFVAHRSWSALVGVGVFLLYPLWRTWYRALTT